MDWFPSRWVEIVGRWVIIGAPQEYFDVCQAERTFIDRLEALSGGQISHHTYDIDCRLLIRLKQRLVLFRDGDAICS